MSVKFQTKYSPRRKLLCSFTCERDEVWRGLTSERLEQHRLLRLLLREGVGDHCDLGRDQHLGHLGFHLRGDSLRKKTGNVWDLDSTKVWGFLLREIFINFLVLFHLTGRSNKVAKNDKKTKNTGNLFTSQIAANSYQSIVCLVICAPTKPKSTNFFIL